MSVQKIVISFFITLLIGTTLYAQDSLEMITEPSVVALYKNCTNEIKIVSPNISNSDKLNYDLRGGIIFIKKDNPGNIIGLIPNSPKVLLRIYKDSLLVGEKEFNVRLIPPPQVFFYADSNLITKSDPKNESINKHIKTLTVKVSPDRTFAYYVPNDAKYSVTSWRIYLIREKKIISSRVLTNGTGNIKKLLAKSKTNDKVLVEVNKIVRTNYFNKEEDIGIEPIIRIFPID